VAASMGSMDAEEKRRSDVGRTSPRGPTRTATTGSATAVSASVAVEYWPDRRVPSGFCKEPFNFSNNNDKYTSRG
jgi:hypothetical protein